MNPLKLRFGLLPWNHRYNPLRNIAKGFATIAIVAIAASSVFWCYAMAQDIKIKQIELEQKKIELEAVREQQAEGKNKLHLAMADPVIRRIMCSQ
jgi:hypothetical protein